MITNQVNWLTMATIWWQANPSWVYATTTGKDFVKWWTFGQLVQQYPNVGLLWTSTL